MGSTTPLTPARLRTRLAASLRQDTLSGILLTAAVVVALAWANSPWAPAYEHLREITIGLRWAHLDLPLHVWAADGLLALFFFIVGNELKQEFVHGTFRDPRHALVPMVAAVTGALVPAGLFVLITLGTDGGSRGWGVPMATDAAFAVAVLALIGRHLPTALRTTLLTLAVVDDLIAIVVTAVFYTDGISPAPLAAAVVLLVVFGWLQRGCGFAARVDRARLPNVLIYAPLVVVSWACVHAAGIHATIAGVAMGLLMRTRTKPGERLDPSHRAEHRLRPWAMGAALPIFALLSTGVAIGGVGADSHDPVTLGVIAGLVVGKLVGIVAGAWLATRLTGTPLDPSLRWIDIVGMSQLAGIGFTVSLLISELSYTDQPDTLEHAKVGVLLGSLTATFLATAILAVRNNQCRRATHDRTGAPRPATSPDHG
ncbi:Na+/H+ antiporter NhaA [Actinophytocola sp.]|uniref:Na+/H+ antiporter NhaA n=1 Tax=Actinophytocola sp. TaxID=1872138 RepID=UPI003D6A7127